MRTMFIVSHMVMFSCILVIVREAIAFAVEDGKQTRNSESQQTNSPPPLRHELRLIGMTLIAVTLLWLFIRAAGSKEPTRPGPAETRL
jgi:hypothetical protein